MATQTLPTKLATDMTKEEYRAARRQMTRDAIEEASLRQQAATMARLEKKWGKPAPKQEAT